MMMKEKEFTEVVHFDQKYHIVLICNYYRTISITTDMQVDISYR